MDTGFPPDRTPRGTHRGTHRRHPGDDVLGEPADPTTRRERRVARLIRDLGIPILPVEVDARLRRRLGTDHRIDGSARP